MNKVPDNQLISVKNFFREELKTILSEREINIHFEACCLAWLNLNKTDLLLRKKYLLSESEILRFLYAIKDFKKHKPLAYVLKQQHFMGLNFYVNESVLIPRPETEELVALITNENPFANSILDIGTGSGCIPLSIKKLLPQANVVGIDISNEALQVATKNASSLNLEVKFLQGDALLLNECEVSKQKWDIVVSNPPYIPINERENMDKNVTEFEPSLALFVPEENPFVFYQHISAWAVHHLNKNGKLYFEIHELFANEVQQILLGNKFQNVKIHQDLQGKNRMISAELIS